MAEGTIGLPVDSVGKVLRTQTGLAGMPPGVHAEVMTVQDAAGNVVSLATDTSMTNGNLRGTVTVANGPGSAADSRGLTERMFAKAPAAGKVLWLDVDSTNAGFIYTAEALAGSDPVAATVWQGIRVQQDVNGNPLGAVQTAVNFAWNARATATWTS